MREERIARLKALLEQQPDDSFSRYALALEYAALEKSADALALLQEVIHRDASYVPAYQQLGYLYQKLNRKEDAIDIFRRGLSAAAAQGDTHARSEIQEALDDMD